MNKEESAPVNDIFFEKKNEIRGLLFHRMDRGPVTGCPRVLCIYTIFIYSLYADRDCWDLFEYISLHIFIYIYICLKRDVSHC